jgi:hypothetical protein
MGLTDRSRLGSIKYQQERLQRKLARQNGLQEKLNRQNREILSASVSEVDLDPTAVDQAWNKYLYAKEIYKETKDLEHWRYAQECLSEYEKVLRQR